MEKRTIYALVAFFALGLGAFLVMRAPQKGDRSGPRPRPVAAFKAAEIESLEVTSEKQEKVLLEKSGSAWRVKSPKDWPADSSSVKSLTDALEKLTFGDLVTEGKDKHDEMGVADGKAVHLIAKGAGGKLLADLFVGKNVGGFTMVRPGGKDEIWQATGLYSYLLNKDAKGWRDHVIFEFTSNDGDKLTVESGANKLALSKIVDKDAKAESKWKIDESVGDAPKTSDALDTALVNGAVQALSTLRAADFADDKPAAETGLAQPSLKLTVSAAGKEHKLLVGVTKGDDVYLQAEGNPTIYTIKKFSFERANHRPADYRDKTLAKVKEVDLAALDLSYGADSISLTHSGDKWTSKKPIDDAKIKPLAGSFENLVGGSISDEKDPAKTGLGKQPTGAVTLHLKDKSSVTLRVGSLTQDKSDYYVQRAGSTDVLLVKKYLVDRFLKKPAELAPSAPKPAPAKSAAVVPKKKK